MYIQMATKKDLYHFIKKTRHVSKSCEPISKLNIGELKTIADKMGYAGQRAPRAPKPKAKAKAKTETIKLQPAGLHNVLRTIYDKKQKKRLNE